jgi:hypothetical protein
MKSGDFDIEMVVFDIEMVVFDVKMVVFEGFYYKK